jgi:hypothetical protein
MGEWPKIIGIIGLALVVGTTLVLTGPLGKALAQWIAGWSKHDARWLDAPLGLTGGDAEAVRAELDEVRRRLAEVEERLDFTERLLAQERQADRLAPPR